MVNLIFLRKPYRVFHLWWGLISLARHKKHQNSGLVNQTNFRVKKVLKYGKMTEIITRPVVFFSNFPPKEESHQAFALHADKHSDIQTSENEISEKRILPLVLLSHCSKKGRAGVTQFWEYLLTLEFGREVSNARVSSKSISSYSSPRTLNTKKSYLCLLIFTDQMVCPQTIVWHLQMWHYWIWL